MNNLFIQTERKARGNTKSSKQAPLQLAKLLEGPGQNLGEPMHRKGRKEQEIIQTGPLAQCRPTDQISIETKRRCKETMKDLLRQP